MQDTNIFLNTFICSLYILFLGQDIIWDIVVVFVNSIIKLINKRRNLGSLEGAEIELYAQQILVIFQEYTKVFSNNSRLLQETIINFFIIWEWLSKWRFFSFFVVVVVYCKYISFNFTPCFLIQLLKQHNQLFIFPWVVFCL